ncbi:MAG: PAS domain S-box protein, partial [Rhodospirillales bacterium]
MSSIAVKHDHAAWPAYAGEMAARIRAHDWAGTPLGDIGAWSASLRTAVGIILTTRQPAFVFWGAEHVCLYNDAYAVSLGPEKHPAILGMPAREAWLETWQIIGPQLQQVMSGGPPIWRENQLVPIVRHGRREDAYWTYSYSPVEDPEAPGIGGVLVLCAETTQAVAQQRAEERLSAALRAGRLGIHHFDPRSGVIEWDAAAARIWGVPADEVVTYEMFVASLHPDDVPHVEALVTRALDPAGEGRYEAEYRVIDRTDGSKRWVRADGDVVFENGEPVRLVGTVQDVTERKQAEQQLRRSRETFYRLIHDNPFGIYIVDADFRLREVSRGAEKVFQNVRPLLGRDFAEVMRNIWTEPFAGEAIGRFRHTLETGEPYAAAGAIERRQDIEETQAYDWRIERVALPDGRFGVVCYFYDLSERRQLGEALRESTDRLQLALDAAGLGTWDLDLTNDTAIRSLRHDQIFGYNEPQPEWGQAIAERHVLDDDKPVFRDGFVRAVETGMLSFEVRVRWPDGSIHWIAPLGRTYYDENGRAVRMAGVVADLTDRKHAEAARQLLVHELNHRVRNLFSVMDAIVYLTAETTRTPGDMAGALRGRLLALARAHELILPAVTGEPRAAGDGDLRELVTAVLSPHLQEGGERIGIDGPRVQVAARAATSLALVLHELTTNAAKYGALSSPQGRVDIGWRLDGERMDLTWSERDGPAVAAAPTARGFGSLLTRSSVEGQLGGSIV